MQNERSGSNSRRRDAAAQRRLQLQEASSNNEEEPEAGVPHLRTGSVRSHSVGPRRQSLRGSYSGHGRAEPPGSEEPAGPSNSQPPALEYYRPSDEECEGQPALHVSKLHILTNCSCIINNECLTSIVFKVSFCLQLSCTCRALTLACMQVVSA